jgi:hypothetical protein
MSGGAALAALSPFAWEQQLADGASMAAGSSLVGMASITAEARQELLEQRG